MALMFIFLTFFVSVAPTGNELALIIKSAEYQTPLPKERLINF